MKPLVALYKCYRGGEWFRTSLESISRQIVGAVAVLADRPWDPRLEALPGNCAEPFRKFALDRPDLTVVETYKTSSREEEQYAVGLRMIGQRFPGCAVLVIDTDEIWEEEDLIRLRRAITDNPDKMYFKGRIQDHVKSPLYRIEPQPTNRPLVALQSPLAECRGVRFNKSSRDNYLEVDATYYHYPYVRWDWNEITHKLFNTGSQDGPVRHNWFQEVWANLPWGGDLHPDARVASFWKGVKTLGMGDLPSALWSSPDRAKLIGCGHGSMLEVQPQFPRMARPLHNPHHTLDGLVDMYLAAHCQESDAVEVGCWAGESAEVACQYVKHLHCVDEWGGWRDPQMASEVECFFDARMLRWSDKITKHKCSSVEASKRFADGNLGIVYLDGDHSYESVRQDIECWLPKIAKGGCLSGHDYQNFKGVIQAVGELVSKTKWCLRVFKDTSWLIRIN